MPQDPFKSPAENHKDADYRTERPQMIPGHLRALGKQDQPPSRPQFSLKTGTTFEESPVGLEKWMAAVWRIVNAKNGISSYEMHRAIGVTQKTAWFMNHRIRTALHRGSFDRLLEGEVEVDETFIGGKARNMHSDVRARRITGRGPTDETIVLGMLERSGTVAAGSALYSDDLASYHGLQREYAHETSWVSVLQAAHPSTSGRVKKSRATKIRPSLPRCQSYRGAWRATKVRKPPSGMKRDDGALDRCSEEYGDPVPQPKGERLILA